MQYSVELGIKFVMASVFQIVKLVDHLAGDLAVAVAQIVLHKVVRPVVHSMCCVIATVRQPVVMAGQIRMLLHRVCRVPADILANR